MGARKINQTLDPIVLSHQLLHIRQRKTFQKLPEGELQVKLWPHLTKNE